MGVPVDPARRHGERHGFGQSAAIGQFGQKCGAGVGHQVLPVGGHPQRLGGATIVHLQGALLVLVNVLSRDSHSPRTGGFYADAEVLESGAGRILEARGATPEWATIFTCRSIPERPVSRSMNTYEEHRGSTCTYVILFSRPPATGKEPSIQQAALSGGVWLRTAGEELRVDPDGAPWGT